MTPNPIVPAVGKSTPARVGAAAAVIGAGMSGQAAARLLHHLGVTVRLLDKKGEGICPRFRHFMEEAGIPLLIGAHYPAMLEGVDFAVTSPGVPMTILTPLLDAASKAAGKNIPLLGEMELALAFVHEPILAVTGSSGKTTTVSLAAAMLRQAGKKVFLGGNIGTPLCDYILAQDRADVLVLEMSSFQLQGCCSLHPKAAVILNLSENHLDQHVDMAEYTDAKFSLFAMQTPEDVAVAPEELVAEFERRGLSARLEIIRPRGRFSNRKLLGGHNEANAEAAYLAAREFGVSLEDAQKAVAEFAPLRHRLETAGTVNGVLYVNDSKSTTVASMRAAVESFDGPVLLLAGGKFKGGDLEGLRPLLQEKVKAVGLFGASREIFEKAFENTVPLSWSPTLREAVHHLATAAEPGDAVLLSPATASYDLYKNYMERGDDFCRIVKELA